MMRTWMRWGACSVGVGLALVPMTGRAGEPEAAPEARHTLVLALPLSGLAGQVGASVEHAVGSHVTLVGEAQVSASSNGSEFTNLQGAGTSTQSLGFGVDPGVHFYFTGRAPEGFWVGPHVELSMRRDWFRNQFPIIPDGSLVTIESSSRTVYYGGSARLGYTAIVASGLTVQVGVGVAALASRFTPFTPKFTPELPATGVVGNGLLGSLSPSRGWWLAPRMTVGLGWAF
jgi:hypothetical protein